MVPERWGDMDYIQNWSYRTCLILLAERNCMALHLSISIHISLHSLIVVSWNQFVSKWYLHGLDSSQIVCHIDFESTHSPFLPEMTYQWWYNLVNFLKVDGTIKRRSYCNFPVNGVFILFNIVWGHLGLFYLFFPIQSIFKWVLGRPDLDLFWGTLFFGFIGS